MKYQSELIKEIEDSRGHEKSSLHYQSECIETWIEEAKGAYPKLTDYQAEWLNYISILDDKGGSEEPPIGEFPYIVLSDVTEATVDNVVPLAYKSAILKGNTLVNLLNYSDSTVNVKSKYIQISSMMKEVIGTTLTIFNDSDKTIRLQTSVDGVYKRQIVIGKNTKKIVELNVNEKLERLRGPQSDGWLIDESGLNELKTKTMILEGDYTQKVISYFEGMQSVTMPVLTTSNEGGTKSNILTVNEDVTLRSNGNVYDELDLLTGKLTQRIDEDGSVLTQEVVKTVELSITDENGIEINRFIPIEGAMHIQTDGTPIKPTVTMEIPVEATIQNLASFIEGE